MPFIFGRRSKSWREHQWFGLRQPFDQKYRTVTSGIIQPWALFLIRLIMALYCVGASLAHIIIYQGVQSGHPANQYYVYFTRLTFIGLTSYFCVAALHTGIFVLSLRQLKTRQVDRIPWFPLQKWGRVLQFLHLYLFSTVITFPFIVTIVYWAFLADKSTFATAFSAWANVSLHMLNSVFLLIELVFGRVRLYWGYWICTIITLALYLGMAYLVHSADKIWVYNFLDPHRANAHVAAYIVGIPVAETIVFVVVWGLIHLRDWFFPRGRGVRVIEPTGGKMTVV